MGRMGQRPWRCIGQIRHSPGNVQDYRLRWCNRWWWVKSLVRIFYRESRQHGCCSWNGYGMAAPWLETLHNRSRKSDESDGNVITSISLQIINEYTGVGIGSAVHLTRLHRFPVRWSWNVILQCCLAERSQPVYTRDIESRRSRLCSQMGQLEF